MAVRVTVPTVTMDRAPRFPGHTVIVIGGEDRLGLRETVALGDDRL